MNYTEQIVAFLNEKYSRNDLNDNTVLFDIVADSIEFVMLLCDIEKVVDREISLDKIEDITKLRICDINSSCFE